MQGFLRLRIFPRSLRQLVLLAFMLVLFPLLVLAYQAYQSLDNLSSKAAEINHTTLTDVRRSESMTGIALEMERSLRQYCVLGDERLKNLYQNQRQQYINQLAKHTLISPATALSRELTRLLEQLQIVRCLDNAPEPEVTSLLESFSYANAKLVEQTREMVFSRGAALQSDIAKRGQWFGWQSLILFLVSLLLVFLFTKMIIGPVAGIEKMINRLGEGNLLEGSLSFQGPRELRSLAQRIVWLSERLSWLESQRHEFLRHISHELKTPLASMREGTELLQDEVVGSLTLDQQEVVAILNSSSRHLQQLIEQLLDYNRRLSERPLQKEEIALRELVEVVLSAHTLPARAKNMKTECHLLQEKCWAEPQLLASVLDNLYSNAVHYGAESGNIWISSRREGNRIHIDVANSGTPIPESERTMIFEPFYQGSHQRKGAVKGSGLGLSIARDCIRRMQGELTLVNHSEAEVCFRIDLPLLAEKE